MQTEKKSLSLREKLLLLLLAAVMLFAIMVLCVILPLYNRLSDQAMKYNALEFEKSQIDRLLASETIIKSNNSTAIDNFFELSGGFLYESQNHDIGRMLTRLCEDHGLRPVEQSISTARVFSMDGEVIDASEDEDAIILIVSATMTVEGRYYGVKDLLDAIEDIDYIRVSRVTFNVDEESDAMELDRIVLDFEVAMLRGEGEEISEEEAEADEADTQTYETDMEADETDEGTSMADSRTGRMGMEAA